MRKLTIWDIVELTSEKSPYFFSPATLKFFGQTRGSFKVYKEDDGRYFITAPMKHNGKIVGYTERFFNPENNELELS